MSGLFIKVFSVAFLTVSAVSVNSAFAQEQEKKGVLDRIFNRTETAVPATSGSGSGKVFVPQQNTGSATAPMDLARDKKRSSAANKKSGMSVFEELELVKEINYANNEKAMAEIAMEAARKQEIFEANLIKELGYDPKEGKRISRTSGTDGEDPPRQSRPTVVKVTPKKGDSGQPTQEKPQKPSLFNRIQ